MFATTQKAHPSMPFALSTKGERSSMTENLKKIKNSSRPHAQEGELRLLIMAASTPTLGRESVKIYYRNDPVKYDLNSTHNASLYLYTPPRCITCESTFLSTST